MSNRTTIKDIAKAANVSSATVSYILNDAPNKAISEETRVLVRSLAQEMNYVPNTSARRLRTNRANCVAVRLSQTLMLPRYHSILQGLRSYLTPRGYSILLVNEDQSGGTAGCMYAYMSGQVDGIIYISSDGTGLSQEEFAQVQERNIPLSAIDCMGDNAAVSSITYDYYATSAIRLSHIIQNGFRRILYLRPVYQDAKEIAREQGIRSASLTYPGTSVEVYQMKAMDEEWQKASNFDQFVASLHRDAFQEARRKVLSVPPDTAVLAYSQELQNIVMHILHAQHLAHPTHETENWYLRGASYHFPHYDAGVEAAASLLNAIKGEKDVRKLSLQPILDLTDPELF